MHLVKLWVPAFVGLFVSLSSASALPVPKLPPEATGKPSIVVRVRPLGELIKDAAYIAKMVGQEEVFEAVKPGIEPVIDSLDPKKPVGFYAKIGPNGIDSHGVLMVPIKNQKDFLATLALLNINPMEGQGGLYTVNAPGAPFPILFRFANGYVYATVKNTDEAEAGLAPAKLYAPDAIFKQGDDSVISVTFNVDAIPNELKRKALSGLEEGVRQGRREIGKEPNAIVRGLAETVIEELATKVQSLVVDTQALTLQLDLDRTKEDIGFGIRLTPRANSELAADLATLSTGKSLGAGIVAPDSAGNMATNAVVPASLKKALAPVIDEFVANGWKKADAEGQPFAKELLEILAPTFKAGILDFGADFRGPNADNYLAMLAVIAVKDGDKLEALARKVYGVLPPEKKAGIKLDVGKAGRIDLHEFDAKLDPEGQDMFGPNAKIIVAFRKDAILFAMGPNADAVAAVKNGVDATAKASPVVEGMASMRRLAPVMERKDAGAVAAAKKAYPAGINDAYRLTVTGGENLDIRLSSSARIIQFGMLLEQARRNR